MVDLLLTDARGHYSGQAHAIRVFGMDGPDHHPISVEFTSQIWWELARFSSVFSITAKPLPSLGIF